MTAMDPDDERNQQVDLRAAAVELGVHYQTAYRWVRAGRLPAHLVAGRYVVDRDDLAGVTEERSRPRPPAAPGPERLERAAERMHEALVEGDEPGAQSLARSLVDEGLSVADLIQSVLVPPLRRVGQSWHDGDITIWVEHRASAIVERLLGVVAPNPRGRRRGTAVVAAVAGDRHSLPTTMAAVTLRDDNWNVHHLGADVPGEEIVAFCHDHPVDVVVLSVTNPSKRSLAEETAAALDAAGTSVVVGGPGRTLHDLVATAREAVRAARS